MSICCRCGTAPCMRLDACATKCARCDHGSAINASHCECCLADMRAASKDRKTGACTCGKPIEPWRDGARKCAVCSRKGKANVTCSRCHERGHTWQTCEMPPMSAVGPIGDDMVREHRPMTDGEAKARRVDLALAYQQISRFQRRVDWLVYELANKVIVCDRPAQPCEPPPAEERKSDDPEAS